MPWTKGKFLKRSINPLNNGILYLKGGDLTEELAPVKHPYVIHPLNKIFDEDFFETKAVVYVKVNT
jgi:16S rRNA (guanine527-N7)-methyltransferase